MNKKITESEMLARLRQGSVILAPLVIRQCKLVENPGLHTADARLELGFPEATEGFRFALESKARATPQGVLLAVAQARAAVDENELPMIQVPYLSPERLADLEREQVSGVDLCGNGIVIVPKRIFIVRSGQPNHYPDSRPVNNPYRGRSAMVGRALLQHRSWPTLTRLVQWLHAQGTALSLAQASKAIQAMEEDLITHRLGGTIDLKDPQRLLDKLGQGWGKPAMRARQYFRLPQGRDAVACLSSVPALKWSMTGEATVSRYLVFAQAGPRRIAVSNLSLALSHLEAIPESVPSFADIELLETEEPGFYLACEIDEKGLRWASRLQTWLELQAGEARQQEAARDLRPQILQDIKA